MNCTFLGRQISLQNNEESCWTYTLEGDPTFGSKSPQLFFPSRLLTHHPCTRDYVDIYMSADYTRSQI